MSSRSRIALGLCAALVFQASGASGLTISFDYSFDALGFFSDQARRDRLEAAGAFYEGLLADDLTAISSGGVNTWTARFFNPAIPSSVCRWRPAAILPMARRRTCPASG